MGHPRWRGLAGAAALACSILVVVLVPTSAPALDERWIVQFGGPGTDRALGVRQTDDGLFVVGRLGAHGDRSATGFLRAYDTRSQELLWKHALDTPEKDVLSDVAGVFGDHEVVVAGTTDGAVPGNVHTGDSDAVVGLFGSDGHLQWWRQFGSRQAETSVDVAIADDAIYVSGQTRGALAGTDSLGGSDLFLRAYDLDGNELWTRRFGSDANDLAADVAVLSSPPSVLIAGTTPGAVEGADVSGTGRILLRQYSTSGDPLWTQQFGAGNDVAAALEGGTGFEVAGTTDGAYPGHQNRGATDVFVRRYSADLTTPWTAQLGTDADDRATALAGLVGGTTRGRFFGEESAGGWDAFAVEFGRDAGRGSEAFQIGTPEADGIAAMAGGRGTFAAGWTDGVLGGSSAGDADAILLKIAT